MPKRDIYIYKYIYIYIYIYININVIIHFLVHDYIDAYYLKINTHV